MSLAINEELLASLGFTKHSNWVWDYSYSNNYKFLRFTRRDYTAESRWYIEYDGGHAVPCDNVTSLVLTVASLAHQRGQRETQDQLHDALGLNRLVRQVAEEFADLVDKRGD